MGVGGVGTSAASVDPLSWREQWHADDMLTAALPTSAVARWQFAQRLLMWHVEEELVLLPALVDWLLQQLQVRRAQ